MAEINKKDIVESGIQEEIDKQAQAMVEYADAINKVAESSKKLNEQVKKGASTRKEAESINKKVIENTDIINQKELEHEKIQKRLTGILAKASAERTKEGKILAKAIELRKKQNAAIKEEITGEKAAIAAKKAHIKATKDLTTWQKAEKGSIDKLNAANTILRKRVNAVADAEGKGAKRIAALNRAIDKNNAVITKNSSKLGKLKRGIGEYERGIGRASKRTVAFGKSLLGALGITAGLTLLVGGFKKAIGLGAQFEKGMDKVHAVSGATNEEFELLTANAKELGETTEKTASQVSALQLSLSKLGLTPDEILKSTQAILDLSTATDEDLTQSATVAAATMKGFGLQAEEMNSIVDIMAKSFSSSALDLAKFENSMSKVAPVAKNAGFGIEETTAQLSLLVDRGLEASIAGTSLRNIFLTMSEKGITLEGALNKIKNATDQNAVALDLFGKRGATAAVIMANNQEEADRLTKSYENSAGAAKRMADVMRDNLSGDADKARSAMEGLAIAFTESNNEALRAATQGFTKFISGVNEYLKIPVSEKILEEATNFSLLFDQLIRTNPETRERLKLIEEIEAIYPDYNASIDLNTANEEELRAEILLTNEAYLKRHVIQLQQEEIDDEAVKLAKAKIKLAKEEIDIQTRVIKLATEQGLSSEIAGKQLNEQIVILSDANRETHKFNNEIQGISNQFRGLGSLIKNVDDAQSDYNNVTEESTKIIEGLGGVVKTTGEDIKQTTFDLSKSTSEQLAFLAKSLNKDVKKAAETEITTRENAEAAKLKASELTAAEIKANQNQLIKDTLKSVTDANTQEVIANQNKFAENIGNEKAFNEESNRLALQLIDDKINGLQTLIDTRKLTGDQILATEEKINKLTVERQKEVANQGIKTAKDAEKAKIEAIKDTLRNNEKTYSEALTAEKERYANGEISAKEYADNVNKITNDNLLSEIDTLEDLIDATEVGTDQRLALEKQLHDAKKELLDNEVENVKRTEAQKTEIRRAAAQVVLEVGNTIFDIQSAQRDQEIEEVNTQQDEELNALTSKYNSDVAAAGNNASLKKQLDNDFEANKERLDEKFNEERKKLQTEQAKADRLQALFQITISTAAAIAAASPVVPLMIAAGIVGAAQTALVLATPIPEFDGGTGSLPGLSKVAEKRPEFVTKNGKTELFTKPTILGSDYKGASVTSGSESANILDSGIMDSLQLNGVVAKQDNRQLDKLNEIKDILGRKRNSTNILFGKEGITEIHREEQRSVTYIDKFKH